jgi:hypothetical protein
MPKGPQGQKRPADVVSNAVQVMRIATGDESDGMESDGAVAAALLGRLGGKARAKHLSAKERTKIAKNAAAARWSKSKSNKS